MVDAQPIRALDLTIGLGYIERLLANTHIEKYLAKHHVELLNEFNKLLAAGCLGKLSPDA